MRMWESTTAVTKKTNDGVSIRNRSDADDFYVFMYDEEDKQQHFNK
jgi:hypothetical protein